MGLFILQKKFTFEAAHKLPHHDGKCARLHGHSWVGWLVVMGEVLFQHGPKQGMLLDYGDLSKIINPIVEDYLDHHFLNETLGMESPTSENIAQWIYHRLKSTDEVMRKYLYSVIIEETCTAKCTYRDRE